MAVALRILNLARPVSIKSTQLGSNRPLPEHGVAHVCKNSLYKKLILAREVVPLYGVFWVTIYLLDKFCSCR